MRLPGGFGYTWGQIRTIAFESTVTKLGDGMYFGSDNGSGASPRVLDAIVAAAMDMQASYGRDAYHQRATEKIRAVFEHTTAEVHFVSTGTAANVLALSALTPPYGAILCHEESHINTDECGAPEFLTGGAKLIAMPGEGGKLDPVTLTATLQNLPNHPPHNAPPKVLSLTQSTELGRVYTAEEVAALCAVAKGHGLRVHMDGARFANAVIGSGDSPAALTWQAGVDVLCLSATKNGALGVEAVIFFHPHDAIDFSYRVKHAGHLVSKQRWMGAQMLAWFENDHWLDLARTANARAAELADRLATLPNVQVLWTPQANEVFALMPPNLHDRLQQAGAVCYAWTCRNLPEGVPLNGRRCVRFVTSFCTTTDDISALMACAIPDSPVR